MCTSDITIKKLGKLLGEMYFYNILFFILFFVTGIAPFSFKAFLKICFPFFNISSGFVNCYLLFYLFIPYLNKLIHALTEKEHRCLMLLLLLVYTALPSFAKASVAFNYITWFGVLYIIASYLRLYPKRWFSDKKLCGLGMLASLFVSWSSCVVLTWLGIKVGRPGICYFFVSDSNKILAVVTAVFAFLFFKTIEIKQSRIINTVAASTFGVLLIHANSDAMRQWLWTDMLQNTAYYDSPMLYAHAFGSVILVFAVCTIIDCIRMGLLEKPIGDFIRKKRCK